MVRNSGVNKTFEEIQSYFDKIRNEIDKAQMSVEQMVFNTEHAKERLEADLHQGFYFDGKESWELIKKDHNGTIHRKKVKLNDRKK